MWHMHITFVRFLLREELGQAYGRDYSLRAVSLMLVSFKINILFSLVSIGNQTFTLFL